MKSKIILLSYMKYVKKDKETGVETPMTRLSFTIDSDLQDTEKFVGLTPVDCFYKGHDVFNKMSKGLLMRPIDAEFEIKNDYYNPLSLRRMLVKINDISLL